MYVVCISICMCKYIYIYLYACVYITGLQPHPPRHGHGSPPPLWEWGGLSPPGNGGGLLFVCMYACMHACMHASVYMSKYVRT